MGHKEKAPSPSTCRPFTRGQGQGTGKSEPHLQWAADIPWREKQQRAKQHRVTDQEMSEAKRLAFKNLSTTNRRLQKCMPARSSLCTFCWHMMYVHSFYGYVALIACAFVCIQNTQLTGCSHPKCTVHPVHKSRGRTFLESHRPLAAATPPDLGNHCPDFLQYR